MGRELWLRPQTLVLEPPALKNIYHIEKMEGTTWFMLKDPGSSKCPCPLVTSLPLSLPQAGVPPTASGATAHDDLHGISEIPVQGPAISFAISIFPQGRITSPPMSPHHGQRLHLTCNFLRMARGGYWCRLLYDFPQRIMNKSLLAQDRVSLHSSLAW